MIQEGARTLSFAGPGAADIQFDQPLVMEEMMPPRQYSANSDEQLTVMHESWS
jgi:hypothetical protein